jgi:signal transduction histidine kinase/CheY-like chemotaxis protein
VEHYETVRVRKNGTMVDVSATLSPIEDAAGRIVGIATICRDVTDRKQAEAALLEREEQLAAARDQALEASRLKSQFLANMSHEIRTPMNGVLGMAQLLLTGHLEPAQRRRAMRLHESGQSLLTIINDILDVSKMEAGKLELEETDFNLVSAVESVVSLCSSSANDKGLTLTVDVAPGTPAWVRGDALRLRQILVNIVGNAVKFTERGGVDIGIRQAPGGNVRFTVRDTGIGLDPSAKAYLLEPFSQADASTTRRFGGTGLGLAICRQLVELMGGVLDFTSEVGAGTTFWFELALPAAPDRDPAAVPAGWRSTDSRATVPAGAGPGPIDAATILLVDDVEINREVGKGLVERLGYQVDTVGSGAEAVDAVQRGAYTAVLMDCLMPVMDGYQATAVIRRLDGPVRCIPVIAVTAAAMSDDRDRCLAAGMTDYVSKPLELGRLAAVLARCLPGIAPAEAVLGEGGAQGEGVEAALADRLELIRSSLSPAAFDRICQVFLADTPDLIARLGAAAGAGDTDTARSVAHNLKGATATMGARRLSALAECLEAGVATTDAGALLREMAEEYDTARSVVLALMTPSPGG